MNNVSSKGNMYSEYNKLMLSYKVEKGQSFTNTRIGDKDSGIFGGIYDIKYDDKFWKEYHKNVFINRNSEYLTEKQLIEDGPLLVDLDFRYDISIKNRQHTKEHIIDLLNLYLFKLNEIYNIPNNTNIDIYVLEKPNINLLSDKCKDGIHLIFTIKMHKAHQCLLRKKIINDLKNIWSDLNIINNYEEILDEGISKGFTNWQLYGSRKPNNEQYKLSYYYTVKYNKVDEEWNFLENKINTINIVEHLPLMSARYKEHVSFDIKDNKFLRDAIQKELSEINKNDIKIKTNKVVNNLDVMDFSKIDSQCYLDELIEIFLETLNYSNSYEIKETHYFTLILPEQYYEFGNFNKWIRVGWALKNTHENLFLTWLKLSSKSKNFDYRDVDKYYYMWKTEFKNMDGLTNRSIMYWAKTDNFEEYKKIRQETISYFIDKTLETIISKDKVTEFDLATVLYQLCKDQFVCVNVKNNQWYEFKNNKWNETDSGNTLRLIISKRLHDIYIKKAQDLIETITKLENSDQNTDILKTRSSKMGDICIILKTTSWKNNIMKEAKDLFYDKEFLNKLDSNSYLLSFNNYVIDFKEKIYRKGRPDDFISKSTNINYIPYKNLRGTFPLDKTKTYETIIKEINQFMDELFPNKELNQYMWEHLASVLIGTNENQTFNIYTGSGCNGKSKLVELMSKCLGDYKATVPITLITQSRNGIGSTSPEIAQLVGVRYAVMQEPSKGEKINEGIMKEITGGDPIQGRALFKDTITYIPQFKLVVCTNVLFDIKTNDDGTWRRIRVADFMSKFLDSPYENESKFPKSNFPYQYLIDRKIDEKFSYWAPVFISMLCEKAFATNGIVKDVNVVLAKSDKYREGQDYLTEFAREKIIRRTDSKIKKTEILEEFKNWYIMHYGRNNLPNGKEITDYMDKQYGKCNRGKWFHVEICYDENDDDEDIIEDE
jgi:P4 family phage/plasmid primase-like protien